MNKTKVSMLDKYNTSSQTSCCFYAVLDFSSLLPFKLHKDVIKGGRTQV